MAPELRSENFILRMSKTEMGMLKALGESIGLSGADIIRQCIRREYSEKFGDKPPKKRSKK